MIKIKGLVGVSWNLKMMLQRFKHTHTCRYSAYSAGKRSYCKRCACLAPIAKAGVR